MESWKTNLFNRQTSPSRPSYGRSLSDPAYMPSEMGASSRSYPWCGPGKSKRRKNEDAVSNLLKPLSAYRWKTYPNFRWQGGKRETWPSDAEPMDDTQPMVVATDAATDNLGTSTRTPKQVNTRFLQVPFRRSLSEPTPRSGIRFVKPWSLSAGTEEAEQPGYFIRGIFSTLSNGFSRILHLRGEATSEPVREDVKGPPTHRLSCGQSPYTDSTTWERKYCILTDSQLVLLNKEKEMPVEGGPEQQTEATKGRCLRRTVSVPSEGQFPEYPPEGTAKLEVPAERSPRRRSISGTSTSEKPSSMDPANTSPFKVPVSLLCSKSLSLLCTSS